MLLNSNHSEPEALNYQMWYTQFGCGPGLNILLYIDWTGGEWICHLINMIIKGYLASIVIHV